MSRISNIIATISLLILIGCETVVTYELPINQTKIVVEGSIENDVPPLVLISRSFPFFGEVNVNDLGELLIEGAKVEVSSNTRTIQLKEYNKVSLVEDLSPAEFDLIAPALEQFIGFEIDQATLDSFSLFVPDFTFYTVAPGDIDFVGVLGETYQLKIEVVNDEIFGNQTLTATTTIPNAVPIDSLWVEDHPNSDIDSLFQLRVQFEDPPELGNYYRTFNRLNKGAWLTPNNSVFDDAFINGEVIPFTIFKGQTERDKLADLNFDIVGYWAPGELAEVKLCVIEEDHYQFWRTVENEKNNLGSPFGSFTIISSNVEGAVGIWGGYATIIDSIVIPDL